VNGENDGKVGVWCDIGKGKDQECGVALRCARGRIISDGEIVFRLRHCKGFL